MLELTRDAIASTGREPALRTWKPLHLLNGYRVILAGLFVVLVFSGAGATVLGTHNPSLFAAVSVAYLLVSVFSSFAIRWRWMPFNQQVYIQVLIDIVVITLLTYASGGVASGLGMLLVVAIAGGSTLMAGRMAILFAAIAAIFILIEESLLKLYHPATDISYTHAGVLGASMFATALLAHVLAQRLRESEALAAKRSVDLASLEQLNDYVIQHMQTGIVVVDRTGIVRLINDSAWRLLGMPAGVEGTRLQELSGELGAMLETWRSEPEFAPHPFRATANSPEVLPRFARLDARGSSGALIFVEDRAITTQHAQQIKLASLGRLTAGIAHEIRNPLGAISHASQLLAESASVSEADQRLTQIILDNSHRTNRIIESILKLSRRDRAQPELFELQPWLKHFLEEFIRDHGVAPEDIGVDISPEDISVRIDPVQFYQVLSNLCKNGLRHGADYPGTPKLELHGGISEGTNIPYLEILDHGSGIDEETAQQIFEPFFTTESSGTGLGLYIARELCEGNQARLSYFPVPGGGSCFRITFADPRRRQVA